MAIQDHLEKLKHFNEVARAGSIKLGAQNLGLTQPSVSKSIQILEDAIGSVLFVRHPRGISLTAEGRVILEYCDTLFRQTSELEARLKHPKDPMAGRIRVGTYDSIAIYFWPKFLASFLKKFPLIDLELTTDRSRKIQHMVENEELDLGLIIEPQKTSSTEVIDLYLDTFQLYQSTKIPTRKRGSEGLPLIYMPDAITHQHRSHLMEMLSSSSGPVKQFRTSSLESTKELTVQGVGLGLLPKMVAQSALDRKQIKLVRIFKFSKEGIYPHRVGLIYPKTQSGLPLLQGFIEAIQKDSE